MIKVDCPEPSTEIARLLAGRRHRQTRWESRNPRRIQGDSEINTTLRDAFYGKCGYCECIEAETIDHFWPQSPNVDRIWDWDNYIWSCYPCQQRKRNLPPVNDAGYQMVNPREDEPLIYLRINPLDGKIFALPVGGEVEQRGTYTISILELDQRPDLDEARRLLYNLVVYLLFRIVDPHSHPVDIDRAWHHMREVLNERRPYLAIIQQLFTYPSTDLEPLVEHLYKVIPDAWAFLERFRRPL